MAFFQLGQSHGGACATDMPRQSPNPMDNPEISLLKKKISLAAPTKTRKRVTVTVTPMSAQSASRQPVIGPIKTRTTTAQTYGRGLSIIFSRTCVLLHLSRAMKRSQGATPASNAVDEAGDPCVLRKRPRCDARAVQAPFSFFDALPGELALASAVALDETTALALWSLTSHRHHALASDASLWRRLCETRFGPRLLHVRFGAAGKSWRWLYRAQSCPAACVGVDVSAVVVHAGGRQHVYWGDCLKRPVAWVRTGPAVADASLPRVALAVKSQTWPRRYDATDRSRLWRRLAICTQMRSRRAHLPAAHSTMGNGKTACATATVPTPKTDHRYKGEFVDGRAHGHGVCTYADGNIYQG